MTFEQSVLTCVSLAAVAVMAAMGVVVCVTEFHLSAIRQSLQDFRRLPWYAQLFLVAFVSHFVVYGSVKTNQTDRAGGDVTNAPLMMLMMSLSAGTLSGWRFRVSRCGSWENADEFVCPLTATNDPIAAVCGDFSYTPSIAVIEPNGIETRNPSCVTYGVQPGRAGWVGLRQDYYVLPLDVSFTGISIEEVPCTRGTRSGYFNNSQFDVISCHSRAMGAGRWLSVGLDNKAGLYDTSSMTMELMRVNAAGDFTEDTNCCWTAGSVIWDIPFGWGPTNNVCNTEEVLPVGLFCQDIKQHFEINQEGDVTVRKFGNSAERLITGQLKLNGELWGVQ